ncbi:hypothetical protein OAO21_07075 [Alphaproteobacteria bacterium]|nr:hypothetical protein [Alphaproteobacteria bacterium]
MKKNKPKYIITGDLDWASEDCLDFYLTSLTNLGIKPLVFATHKSNTLLKYFNKNLVDIGLHPNFRKNSTQGCGKEEIIYNLVKLYPKAKIFRCHGFQDSQQILSLFYKKNIFFDSNQLNYMESNIEPINKKNKLIRFPVYWSDGMAILKNKNNYTLEKDFQYNKLNIFTDGLKIFNIHPFNYCFNFKNIDQYNKHKYHTTNASKDVFHKFSSLNTFGIRNYVNEIIKIILDNGYQFTSFEKILNRNLQLND